MKYAVVILDGAAGEQLAVYGGRTTLEQAHTPYLDSLAANGLVGLAHNVPEGMEPSSNIACTSIMGYDPNLYPIGRGALEGAALGIDLQPGQVAMRLNLTNVSADGIMVSYSTDNISNADGHALMAELKAVLDDETFELHVGTGFRGILVVNGHPELMQGQFTAAHNITDEPVADYPASGPGSDLRTDYCARAKAVLDTSPVNARREQQGLLRATDVCVFWPGERPDGMEPFTDCRGGLSAGMLSGVDLLNGIAQLTGVKRYSFAGVTDGPDNDYAAQGEGALSMLAEQDVVFIHIESPDAEGHDGNVAGKLAAVEAIDREVISRLSAFAADDQTPELRILALPDHPTPVLSKRHSKDPVPFVLCGPGIPNNNGQRLTEHEAQASGLVVDPGFQLLDMLLA
jgi:2,3-bisphosphoglycerate-independent phosphoglycerate mutase